MTAREPWRRQSESSPLYFPRNHSNSEIIKYESLESFNRPLSERILHFKNLDLVNRNEIEKIIEMKIIKIKLVLCF